MLLAQVQHGHLVDGDGDEVLDTDLDLYVNLERSSWGIISRVLLRGEITNSGGIYCERCSLFHGERDYWKYCIDPVSLDAASVSDHMLLFFSLSFYKLPAQKELSRLNKYPAVEEILVLGAAVTNNIEGFYSHSVSLPKAEQGAK